MEKTRGRTVVGGSAISDVLRNPFETLLIPDGQIGKNRMRQGAAEVCHESANMRVDVRPAALRGRCRAAQRRARAYRRNDRVGGLERLAVEARMGGFAERKVVPA